ncbi:GNAT family N-acetyltransferase [Gammaproteobacteria bacterium]|nr:GNAT family N-acetyltransferase [Gammaproteobacteria bacterium]MDC1525427.1 GNAT family N-acetyltransferase [Gammaproteobacteria bacterium]
MNVPKIITADLIDLERVKGVLKLGFASDALLRWVFPDAQNYLKSFDLWMIEFSKIAYEHNLVYSEQNFAGASIWHPPGVEFDAAILEPTFDAIPPERLETVIKFFEEFETYHPDDAWYLAFIAVDPSQQRKGIGSFLLKEALQMIDQKGDRAYLEASNEQNKALYERHGFIEIGKVQFEDSPPAFPMIREAR